MLGKRPTHSSVGPCSQGANNYCVDPLRRVGVLSVMEIQLLGGKEEGEWWNLVFRPRLGNSQVVGYSPKRGRFAQGHAREYLLGLGVSEEEMLRLAREYAS